MGKWTKQHNTRPPHTHIVSVRIETLDAVVEVIRHVDLARMGDRKSRPIRRRSGIRPQPLTQPVRTASRPVRQTW